MIKASCYTNLDEFRRYDWPSVFVSVPGKGDYVESVCRKRLLKVASIMHTVREEEPMIVVELHK